MQIFASLIFEIKHNKRLYLYVKKENNKEKNNIFAPFLKKLGL